MPRRTSLPSVLAWAAAVVTLGGCGTADSTTSGPPEARLVVIPEETRDGMFALVRGTLGINEEGCFVLDDRVLVVGKGSRVLPGETSIEVADVGVVEVGTSTSGGGGYIDGEDEVERIADAYGIGEVAMACQPEGEEPALTVLDPAGP